MIDAAMEGKDSAASGNHKENANQHEGKQHEAAASANHKENAHQHGGKQHEAAASNNQNANQHGGKHHEAAVSNNHPIKVDNKEENKKSRETWRA